MEQSWFGRLTLGPSTEFIQVTQSADGAILDCPGRYRFNIPLQGWPDDAATADFRADSLHFQGQPLGQRIEGTVQDGDTAGSFWLERAYDLARQDYRPLMGHYRLASDQHILVSQDDRGDVVYHFYIQGDQVIRLHPLSPTRFLSARADGLTFTPDGQDRGLSLTMEGPDGATSQAEQVEPYIEQRVSIPRGDYALAGSLLVPSGPGPHPAVIFCHHASVHQRDYYRLFADAFVRRGIAAFIYDKRGRGESTGEPLFSEIFQLADDAEAVFRFVQAQPTIRSDRVGFWGISNGAWVAPLAASRVGQASFVIGASVAGVTPARQEQIRRVNVARDLGASPRALTLLDRFWPRMFQFYIDGSWDDNLETLLRAVYEDKELQALPKHPGLADGLQSVPPRVPLEQIRAEGGAWPDGAFDVSPIYEGLRCPVLCVWGETDTVIPVAESRQRLEQALRAQQHPDYGFTLLPDTTHHLYLAGPEPSGILREVMHTRLYHVTLPPGLCEGMADWTVQRVQF
ncbi:MAG: alpha/beta fold hydrolase [Anaerolineae bacterium]|nr:alpha/beta fold hydrolase [Anaerolineae bacterium]